MSSKVPYNADSIVMLYFPIVCEFCDISPECAVHTAKHKGDGSTDNDLLPRTVEDSDVALVASYCWMDLAIYHGCGHSPSDLGRGGTVRCIQRNVSRVADGKHRCLIETTIQKPIKIDELGKGPRLPFKKATTSPLRHLAQ